MNDLFNELKCIEEFVQPELKTERLILEAITEDHEVIAPLNANLKLKELANVSTQ